MSDVPSEERRTAISGAVILAMKKIGLEKQKHVMRYHVEETRHIQQSDDCPFFSVHSQHHDSKVSEPHLSVKLTAQVTDTLEMNKIWGTFWIVESPSLA